MGFYKTIVPSFAVLVLFFSVAASGSASERTTRITHADAAVIIAKYSGLFDRYVPADADLNYCVSFLNEYGIYFGLMEVVNGKEFMISDCARAMGQAELVLSGEAEYVLGKVRLPKDVASWEDFCIMQGVQYREGYQMMVHAMQMAAR